MYLRAPETKRFFDKFLFWKITGGAYYFGQVFDTTKKPKDFVTQDKKSLYDYYSLAMDACGNVVLTSEAKYNSKSEYRQNKTLKKFLYEDLYHDY